MSLIASPGPDSSLLAPARLPAPQPQVVATVPPPVTPPPTALPAPGDSWLERQLQQISDAIATGKTSAEQSRSETQSTIRQIASTDIIGSVQSTLDDVHRAGQLQQMLPFVIAAIGIVLGKPVIGIGAGVLVWLAGQKK
jgi:hypothetical protein